MKVNINLFLLITENELVETACIVAVFQTATQSQTEIWPKKTQCLVYAAIDWQMEPLGFGFFFLQLH